MKLTVKQLKEVIRGSLLSEESWVPGRWMPDDGEPVDPDELQEIDTDPSNNPGRPSDAYEYIGMHPTANAALAHPSVATGASSNASAMSNVDVAVDSSTDEEAI